MELLLSSAKLDCLLQLLSLSFNSLGVCHSLTLFVLSKSQVEQMQPAIFGSCWSGHIGGPRMGVGFLSVFFHYFQL